MSRSVRTLWRNADGAVAPMVALSLVGLVAAGGIAFDYARLASMDTELQDAADQAALAAASQLDGQTGACARAAAAASALVANRTMFANDNANATAINVQSTGESACDATGKVRFYQSYDSRQCVTTLGAAADERRQRESRRHSGRRPPGFLCADPDRCRDFAARTFTR